VGQLEDDRETVFAALRSGHAYIAMDAVAPARGFSFWAKGERTLLMGDEARADGEPWLVRAELPRRARLRLMRDGHERASADAASSIEHRASGPGVYRIEAYLHAHGRDRTWILSNPIYLR
jgi:hypothetical protein